jgi:hypothetical protein
MKPVNNFTSLWTSFIALTTKYNDTRTRAVLMNSKDKKEKTLRRLGVICSNDLSRIEAKYKSRV